MVTLLVVVTAFLTLQRGNESRGWVEHTHEVLDVSQRLVTQMLNAETGVRAFAATGDAQFLGSYVGVDVDVRTNLHTLRQLTRDNPVQQRRLRQLTAMAEDRLAILQRIVAERRGANAAAVAPLLVAGRPVMANLWANARALEMEEYRLLGVRSARDHRNQGLAEFIISVGGLIAVLIALVANRHLIRNAAALDDANQGLTRQAAQLTEQATELESQASALEATATELEATNVELEEQALELEEQRDAAHDARAEAEQANAAKSRFLSVMSHELRTPLNAIAGYVDIMDAGVHGPISAEQQEDIRRIKRAVAQLTSVINDILNFAKLEAGEVRFQIGDVQMSEALANAYALMEPQAAAKGVRLVYTPCDAVIVARADRERVQQIILNLLSNAVKYTSTGGEVRMRCTQDGYAVAVRVSDTGRGIAPTDLRRIFDPFVQLLGAPHAPSDGVGLGLAISRDLARGMGGDITVQSQVGAGSLFQVTLPSAVVHADDGWVTGRGTPEPAALSDPGSRTASRSD